MSGTVRVSDLPQVDTMTDAHRMLVTSPGDGQRLASPAQFQALVNNRTATPTANTETSAVSAITTINLGATDTVGALVIADSDFVTVNSTGGALTGAGHAIGYYTKLTVNSVGPVTHPLMIVQESAVTTVGPAGNITQLFGHLVHPIEMEGFVARLACYSSILSEGDILPTGLVLTMIDYLSPDFSTITNTPVARWCVKNEDPGKLIETTGRVLLASGQEGAPAPHNGVVAGRYYAGVMPATLAPVVMTAGLIYFIPTFIPARTTITRLGCQVTNAVGGSNLQMAIYRSVAGVPDGAPLLSTVSQSSATTGAKEVTVDLTLEAGMYLFAVNASAGISINFLTDAGALFYAGASTSTALETSMRFTQAFGTWPSTPAVTFSAASGSVPHVWWRVV